MWIAWILAQTATAPLPLLPPAAWGTQPAEAASAIGPEARTIKPDRDERVFDQDWLLAAPAAIGDIAGEYQLFFTARRELSVVKFTPSHGRDCPALVAAIRADLGEGESMPTPSILAGMNVQKRMWQRQDEDRVMLYFSMRLPTTDKTSCHVTAQPYGDGIPGPRDRRSLAAQRQAGTETDR